MSIIRRIVPVALILLGIHMRAHEFQSAYSRDEMVRIQKEINAPDYIESVLPYDLSHMTSLLNYSGTNEDTSYVYLRSVMKMYTNFSKQVSFFDADMVLLFLDRFSNSMMPILNKTVSIPLNKNNASVHANVLYEQLFGAFSTQYNAFKEDPEQFLHNISTDIARGAVKNGEYMELQQSIVRFLEHALSKLLFDPNDHQKSWNVVKQVAATLSSLKDKKIIADANALDDILISLSSRYTYFLQMFSDTLTYDFLTQLQKEITTTSLPLFAYDTNAVFGRKAQLSYTIHECLLMCDALGEQQIIAEQSRMA